MSKESRGIQSIEVGGELLRALARSGEPMMLRDLAREAGMAPAKAHPYLVSFSRIGLIEQDETTGRYEFGALALELGLISLRRLSAVRIATPRIAALANEINHAVSLAVWGTQGPTVVRLEEPSHPVHIVMRVGSVMAMLETATGREGAAGSRSRFARPKTDGQNNSGCNSGCSRPPNWIGLEHRNEPPGHVPPAGRYRTRLT